MLGTNYNLVRRGALLSASLLAITAAPALAQTSGAAAGVAADAPQEQTAQAPAEAPADEQEIVVSGYRASLESQTNAKRNSIGFTDTIFAEDIGKFPDTNIAESVNRIPGVTIQREVTGEGSNVAIRGLGTNFTRVLLNGAPVAVASVRFDAQSTNREVDLDLLPTELFTQLTVSKSPVASQVEGGAAGTVNLRSARPFDNPKPYLSYGLQGSKVSSSGKWGYRGHVLASATFGDFGILAGASLARNEFHIDGFETIGWTNPNLSAAQRPTGANATGGGNFTIPATVPANAGNGLIAGTTIDQAFLLARNPGATIDQIDNGLIPRLGRPRTEVGYRDRKSFLASAEWRPSDALHFYIDGMYSRRETEFTRTSMNWVGRNGAAIPLNTTYDRSDCTAGCVVTGGTYANAQFFLEYRPYHDTQEYWGVNPGVEFVVNDFIKGDLQANYTKSNFHRESPTVLVITPPSSGVTATYVNDGGIPQITSNIDLNNPASFGWAGGGRVNLNGEDRDTETKGVRGSLLFGDAARFSVRVGAAYDDTMRRITPFDNTNPWQNAICGNAPSVTLPAPNTGTTPCTGLSQPGATPPAGFPTFPGYGTNYTTGGAPITYAGSIVPTAAVPGYLLPGSNGFITVDWDKFRQATGYDALLANATEVGSGSSGANGGLVQEKVTGTFAEANGVIDVGDNTLRLNAGLRYVRTEQIIGGRVSVPDPRNTLPGGAQIADGGRYPNIITFPKTRTLYSNFLPSASLAFDFAGKAVARASFSKTMTRPDPNALLPGASFVQPSADIGTVGNPELDPYVSTNIDLGFEYYTGGEGVIAVAAFRKSITGFTVNGTRTVPFSFLSPYGITFDSLTQAQQGALLARALPGQAPQDVNIVLQQQVNSDGKLKVNGLEFQITQPLDFLTSWAGIRGFGFQGNLTLIDQKGEGTGAPAVAIGVAPTTYTLTGYYEGNGLSARLTYTFNEGSQGSNPNQNGIPAAAIFGRDYSQLDFSGSLDLGKLFDNKYLPSLVLNVINITKQAQSSYFQFENATFNQYNPGRQVLVGIRGRF
ncbi:TonB-dependent receptor [Sphingomonas naasensis]|uniref:TonB-dependent receptor n=1 Tax=Sphingomonas naasensis TaxID=1344951 RepID=A0A4V3QWP5_9SPHN|nr:TonB-dependent receptor [Sphingomonas naasensis]NIJ21055.1 TonB-dependent receptor [Sphingomonas naasensis]TGX43432.1 TonB-dependent receptor [Sphingomonas naasensis]